MNTNVAALNAWRNLENTQSSMTNVLQQLSSGYRINTAADDPAGLAISQQMQAQIGGLNQAYLNSQTGVSLLQTADGALGQIQNILQSMRSLASEAATATMNSTDTQNLQTEMDQYAKEISQITNTTQFNNINLLGGAFQNQNVQVGANQGQSLSITLGAADAATLGVAGDSIQVTAGATMAGVNGATGVGLLAGSDSITATTTPWSISSISGNTGNVLTGATGAYTGSSNDALNIQVTANGSGTAGVASVTYTDTGNSSPVSVQFSDNATNTTFKIDGITYTLADSTVGNAGATYNLAVGITATSTSFKDGGTDTNGLSGTTSGEVQTGQSISMTNNGGDVLSFDAASGLSGNTTAAQTYTISGNTSPTAAAATTTTATFTTTAGGKAAVTANGQITTAASVSSGINITTQVNAEAALTIIDNAINTLSTERANVGAYQNRLQFAASDAQTAAQNLTSARGGIMDADMALQMSNLAKDQVLQQSGVAMLAQANAVPQALLKLLP